MTGALGAGSFPGIRPRPQDRFVELDQLLGSNRLAFSYSIAECEAAQEALDRKIKATISQLILDLRYAHAPTQQVQGINDMTPSLENALNFPAFSRLCQQIYGVDSGYEVGIKFDENPFSLEEFLRVLFGAAIQDWIIDEGQEPQVHRYAEDNMSHLAYIDRVRRRKHDFPQKLA